MLKKHMLFMFNKYIKIILLCVTILFALIFTFITSDNLNTRIDKLIDYYNYGFYFLSLIITIIAIFISGYTHLTNSDDYRKLFITNKTKYYLTKTLTIYLYIFTLVVVLTSLLLIIGYIKYKLIDPKIINIFISLTVSTLFYQMFTTLLVLLFDNFNVIYISIVIFIFSFINSNILGFIIYSVNDNSILDYVYHLLITSILLNINLYIYNQKDI